MLSWLLIGLLVMVLGLLGVVVVLLARLDGRAREARASAQGELGKLEASVGARLDSLHEATGRITALGASVEHLSRALATPKGRGAFGELSLDRLLEDLLPAEYVRRQWPVEDGAIVDAAILLPEGALVIDAKFPLPAADVEESVAAQRGFRRAVQDRAREIAVRYVRPPKTLGFAFMYVPAESVYHRLIMDRPLHAKLLELRVVPVSPNTLYAFLQTVALGLRGLRIEERAKEVQGALAALRGQWERYADHFRKVGVHLDNARVQYGAAERESGRMADRLAALQVGAPSPEQANQDHHEGPYPQEHGGELHHPDRDANVTRLRRHGI